MTNLLEKVEAWTGKDIRVLVRVITPLIIAGLLTGAYFQYKRSINAQAQRFNERQTHASRQAADRFSDIFAAIQKSMMLLGHMADVVNNARSGQEALTMATAQLHEHGVLAGGLSSQRGGVLLAAGRTKQELGTLLKQLPPCEAVGTICVNGPLRWRALPSRWALVVTTRTAKRLHAEPGQHGQLIMVLDWGALHRLIRRFTQVSTDTYAWVLDHRGHLIMHPHHREQLGRRATEKDASCKRCHTSFDLQERMTRGGAGIGRIQMPSHEPKLVAYTPFRVGNKRWSLAVATTERVATAGSRAVLVNISVFTGAILLAMLLGAVLLDRESSRRIRAADWFTLELEKKVEERTNEIRKLYDGLADLRANQSRLERVAIAGEMAAIVAHEVRTPLNALSINTQRITRLMQRDRSEDRPKIKEIIGTLQVEIERINTLVEEHMLAQVRSRPNAREPILINTIVTDSVRFLEPEASLNHVDLRTSLNDELPEVLADEARVRQILLNILLNAIQAMPEGGKVNVTTDLRNGSVFIVIEDNGPGIAEEVGGLKQVFRPFVTTKEDGTGLGLAICARWIKKMGGTIRLESREGKGATFTVTLPVNGK